MSMTFCRWLVGWWMGCDGMFCGFSRIIPLSMLPYGWLSACYNNVTAVTSDSKILFSKAIKENLPTAPFLPRPQNLAYPYIFVLLVATATS